MILRIVVESSGLFAERYASIELTEDEFDRHWRPRLEAALDDMTDERERRVLVRQGYAVRVRDVLPGPAPVEPIVLTDEDKDE